MSFSSDIKQELNKNSNLSNKEIVKNELIGYLISKNIEIIKNNIKYSTESDYNINRFSKLLSNLNIDYKIEMIGKNFVVKLNKKDVADFIDINSDLIYIKETDLENIKNKSEEDLKAIIRGAFMGSRVY